MKKGKQEDQPVPDHLRCTRTDGRQWRCKRRVLENKRLCEVHFQRGQKRRLRSKENLPLPVPENLRCCTTDGDQWRCKRRVLDNEKQCEVHFHRTRRKQEKLAKLYAESHSIDQEVKVCEPQNLVFRQCQDKQSKFSSHGVSFENNEECGVENLEKIESHNEEKGCEVENLIVRECEAKRTKFLREDTSSDENVVECEIQNVEKNEFEAGIQSIDEDDVVCEVENVIDRQCRFKRTKLLGENASSDGNDVILVDEEENKKELKLQNPVLRKHRFERSKFSRENADFQENVDDETHKFRSKRLNFSPRNKHFVENGVVSINEEPVLENLRCGKTDGRKWRCSRRVMENKKLCEFHYMRSRQYQYKPIKFLLEKSRGFKGKVKKPVVVEEEEENLLGKSRGFKGKVKTPVVVEEEDENLPENLRCCRTDGRKWRCNRRVMKDKKLCQIHYLQGRHRQYKEKVPEELKIQRRSKGSKVESIEMKIRSVDVKGREAGELMLKSIMMKKKKKKKKKKRAMEVLEGLIRALKEMKLRKDDLQLELIRIFLRRQVERCKQRDLEKPNEGELIRDLPYGLMTISSPTSPFLTGIDSFCNVKLGIDSSCFTRRCFRSKNIEPLPIGSLKVVPYARGLVNLRMQCRTFCHRCQRSNLQSLIKCSSCQKEFFCLECINEWYCNMQEEVEKECPVCCETCVHALQSDASICNQVFQDCWSDELASELSIPLFNLCGYPSPEAR
ncbi:WRC domain [Dillenia turbinata]|uniref:Growth-regulating factor n=1 Tax=Dillenia turbinata TaxID=194707 RepID=A0AAN8VCI1_9MAGN